MESIEAKIQRVLRTPSVFNWARQNHPRLDDTTREILNLATNPPHHNLVPIGRLCHQLANRHKTFQEVWDATENYQDFLRMAADEVLPTFDHYLTQRQIEVVPDFVTTPYQYPFARKDDGTVRSIPMQPTFVAIEGDKLIPYFSVYWARPNFKYFQVQLICSIIKDAVLTREDYRHSDAKVMLIRRCGKWGNDRSVETWSVSSYATLSRPEIEKQFGTYNQAIEDVIARLSAESAR